MVAQPDLLTEKMLWMTDRLRRAQRSALRDGADPAPLLEAQGHLYAAQSSHAQGRRAPAGFPLQHLRQEVYQHLLRAERTLDLSGSPAGRGRRGIPLVSRDLTLLVDPGRGGQVVELSDKVAARNLLDGQAGLRDHLFPAGAGLESFLRGDAPEARGFAGGRYRGRLKRSRSSVQAVLSRRGALPAPGDGAVSYTKSVEISSSGRRVRVRQHLRGGARRQRFLFATEIGLGLKDAHVNRIGEAAGIRRFAVVDPAARLQVSWSFSRPARLWHFPVESGAGLHRVYQGVRLTWLWPVELGPRRCWEVRWEMTMGSPHVPGQA